VLSRVDPALTADNVLSRQHISKVYMEIATHATSTNHNLEPMVNPNSLKIAGSILGQQQQQRRRPCGRRR